MAVPASRQQRRHTHTLSSYHAISIRSVCHYMLHSLSALTHCSVLGEGEQHHYCIDNQWTYIHMYTWRALNLCHWWRALVQRGVRVLLQAWWQSVRGDTTSAQVRPRTLAPATQPVSGARPTDEPDLTRCSDMAKETATTGSNQDVPRCVHCASKLGHNVLSAVAK